MTIAYSGTKAPDGFGLSQHKAALLRRGIFCAGLALFLALPGCSLFGPSDPKTEPDALHGPADTQLSPEAALTYKHLVLNESLSKGDQEMALQTVQELLELAPSPELYGQAVMILDQNNMPQEALHMARSGAIAYHDDFGLHMLLAELLERQGNIDDALGVLGNFALRYKNAPAVKDDKSMAELTALRQFAVFMMLDNQRFDAASSYLAAVPANERSAVLRYYEVLILRHNKQNQAARKKLYDIVKEYPDFTDGWLTLAQDMEKAQDYKNAVGFYKKALESAPVPEIFLRLLQARIKAGENQTAMRQVLETPITPELKLRSALLFMDNKQYANAKKVLLSIQNDPAVADDVTLYMGMIAYDTGENMQEALAAMQDISLDAPNRARMLYLKTILHLRLNDYTQAYESGKTLRDEYPASKDNWALLAELSMAAKKYAEAEAISREALEQWPDDVSLMYSLAMSLNFQKKTDESISMLEEILVLDSNNVMAMNALGYTLAENRRELGRALALITEALERQPENVGILDSLAWAHYQMGNYKEAWSAIKKCAAKGTSDAIIWEHYGDIALALGDKNAAAMGYRRALELDPDNYQEIRKKLEMLR